MHTQYNNTHKITTTIHTASQQQLHTRQLKTSNNTHETNQNFTTCTKGKNTQVRQYCVQFLVIVVSTSFCSSSSEYVELNSLPPIPFLSVMFNGALEYFKVHLPPSIYNYLQFAFILLFSLFSILFFHSFSLFTLFVNQNVLRSSEMYILSVSFSSKCSLFHNSNVFGSCIIHILYTGVLKLKI